MGTLLANGRSRQLKSLFVQSLPQRHYVQLAFHFAPLYRISFSCLASVWPLPSRGAHSVRQAFNTRHRENSTQNAHFYNGCAAFTDPRYFDGMAGVEVHSFTEQHRSAGYVNSPYKSKQGYTPQSTWNTGVGAFFCVPIFMSLSPWPRPNSVCGAFSLSSEPPQR